MEHQDEKFVPKIIAEYYRRIIMIAFYQNDIDESSVFGQQRVTITSTYTAYSYDRGFDWQAYPLA